MSDNDVTPEELLERAGGLGNASEKGAKEPLGNQSNPEPEDFVSNVNFLAKGLKKVSLKISAVAQLYSNAINIVKYAYDRSGPVKGIFGLVKKIASYSWEKTTENFKRFAYKGDRSGNVIFSEKRALIFVVAYVFSLLVFWQFLANSPAFVRDFYHVQTTTEKTLYFGQPTFNTSKEIYQVTGCEGVALCKGGDNALIFEIPDNKYLDLRYLLTKGKGYDPEYEIVSAFNSEYMRCTVTVKGNKPLIINYVMGTYKWLPKIIDKAECTHVSGET